MKERLDIPLVNWNLAESRERAEAIIMPGIVYVDGQKEDKAGIIFDKTVSIEVRGAVLKYVSRDGLKLEKTMTHLGVTLDGKVCTDVGSSVGGFTGCMLQSGVARMHTVGMGHGQLAWELRNDERMVCMERTDIRYVTEADVPDRIQSSSIDISFTSLTRVLAPVKALLTDDGQTACLIKPQFEAGRKEVRKKGMAREKSTHLEVTEQVIAHAQNIDFRILNLEFSPVKEPEDNIKYLLYLQNNPKRYPVEAVPVDVERIADEACGTL